MNAHTATLLDQRVDNYLYRLNDALGGLAPAEKQEILLEIRTHILDSTTTAAEPNRAVERVLYLLGTPEELAERYCTERLLTRASRSFSPWLLLQTSWRWAKRGVKGTLAFFVALFGYGLALGLTAGIFLKPFMPSKVGMWIGSEGFNIGVPSHPEVQRELLGNYFVPVIAVIAFAAAVGTTQALRCLFRRSFSNRSYQRIEDRSLSGPAQI